MHAIFFLLLGFFYFFNSLTASAQSFWQKQKVDDLNNLSYEAYEKNDSASKQFALDALQIAKRINYKKGQAEACHQLQNAYSLLNKFDSAIFFQEKSNQLFYEMGNLLELGKGSTELAYIYNRRSQYWKAISLLLEAEVIFLNQKDSLWLAWTYTHLGESYIGIHNYPQAQFYLEKSVVLRKSQKDKRLFESYQLLGEIYNRQKNYQKSLQYIFLALESVKNKSDSIVLYNSLGEIYLDNLKTDSAFIYLKQASVLLSQVPDKYAFHSRNLRNIAVLYRIEKKYDIAEKYIQKALANARLSKAWRGYLRNKREMAQIYFEDGKYFLAYKLFKENIDSLYLIGQAEEYLQNYWGIAQALNLQKRFKESNEYLVLWKNLKDSLDMQAISERLLKMQENYQIKQKEDTIHELEKQNNWQEQILALEKSKNTYLGTILLMTLIILVLLLWFFYKKNILNKKLEQQGIYLEKINVFKDKLFSVLSHDLQSSLLGLQFGLKDIEPNKAKGSVLDNYLSDLSFMLENMLGWARNSFQRPEVHWKEFELEMLITPVIQVFELQAHQKELTLYSQIDSTINVLSDPFMLQLIIRNLVSNAIKFSPKGTKISLLARAERQEIVLEIIDQGIGMSPKNIELFESGLPLESQFGTFTEKGTGIGLMLCREYLGLLAIKCSIKSKEGEGTHFELRIPKA